MAKSGERNTNTGPPCQRHEKAGEEERPGQASWRLAGGCSVGRGLKELLTAAVGPGITINKRIPNNFAHSKIVNILLCRTQLIFFPQ